MKIKEITIGEKIRFFRKRNGFSQLKLEIEAELSPGMISRIENNVKNPTKETLGKIAIALKLNYYEISYLFWYRVTYCSILKIQKEKSVKIT